VVERRQQGWWLAGLPGVGVLWGVAAVGDRLWFSLDHSVPGWDQGGHLTRSMMYWRLVQQANWWSSDWWYSFWTASTKYPPLVYALTVPLFNGLGTSFDTATLINLLFSAILLLAVYGLGSYLFTMPVGVLAAAICLMMPGLYRIRLDYLIDYPLVALVTLSFFCLTVWWGKAKGKWQFEKREWLATKRIAAAPVVSSATVASPTEYEMAEPETAEPETAEPETAKRETAEPETAERRTWEREISQRGISQRRIFESEISEGVISEDEIAEREIAEREIAEREITERGISESAELESEGLEHVLGAIAAPANSPRPEAFPAPPAKATPPAARLPWRFSPQQFLWQWFWAISFGISLGLALLVKQTAIMFFLFPLLWVVLVALRQLALGRLLQLAVALALATLMVWPWFSASWLLILTSVQSSTVEPALAEGDPGVASLESWLYYLWRLPKLVSWTWLLPLLGLVFYLKRSNLSRDWLGREGAQSPQGRLRVYQSARRSLLWLSLFLLGGYLLNALNPNKDLRYVMPMLPALSLLLALGWTLFPKRWRLWRWQIPGGFLRWGMIGLSLAMTGYHLFPNQLTSPILLHRQVDFSTRRAYTGPEFPLDEIVDAVVRADPYEKSTIGLLTSSPELNQHNLTYSGLRQNFQVYARDVGKKPDRIEAEERALSWFLTQTGGAMPPKSMAEQRLAQRLNSPLFQPIKAWDLGDRGQFSLYQRRTPLVEIKPLPVLPVGQPTPGPTPTPTPTPTVPASPPPSATTPPLISPIQLTQVTVPDRAPPGKPIPVTYTWSGPWKSLQPGLVLINWQLDPTTVAPPPDLDDSGLPKPGQPTATKWLHDHAIANGNLQPGLPNWMTATSDFQLKERLAMLPPARAIPGTYTLEVLYQNRQTGETVAIAAPPIRLTLDPTTPPIATALDLDLLTRLRLLATNLPQGPQVLDQLFQKVELMNQYNPGQDYLTQTQQAMGYRLRQDPQNRHFAYTLALAQVLKKDAKAAIATFQTLTQLDPQNPYAYAYLAFLNLYALQPAAAQAPLNTALQLAPTLPELQALKGIAAILQGNLDSAWQSIQTYQKMATQK
jgi:4-amino-4-deoxy-L-arabinose transferase-like glycosyltransferase